MIKHNTAIRFFSLVLIFSCISAAHDAHSQSPNRNFGLGVVLGEPSGVTGKLWLSNQNALSGVAAWSFRGNTSLHLHADYTRHDFSTIRVNRGSMALYYGIGGRVLMGGGDRFGIRVPFGINYLFANDPVDIFIELAPILDLVPSTEFTGNSGIGLRYYF